MAAMKSITLNIGTSGWHYDHWRGTFYPDNLSKTGWLEFYATQFNTVELNNTFYRLPTENAFAKWHNSSPAGFTFAVKASRYITHIKRLKNTDEAVDTFIRRAKLLGKKLGPVLYQLPPGMHRNDDKLDSFLSALPHGMKHVFEFHHNSWFDDKVFETLQKYNVGLCIYDMPGLTTPVIATADFAYIRFHGSEWLYGSNYSDEKLAEWAKKLLSLTPKPKAIYAYFNNDAEGFAINNALTLRRDLKELS